VENTSFDGRKSLTNLDKISYFEEEIKKNKNLARFIIPMLLVVTVLLIPTSALASATVYHGMQKYQISTNIYVPCAGGGAGEYLDLTGEFKSIFHVTFLPDGTFNWSEHYTYKGWGIGRTTGDRYRWNGEENYSYHETVGLVNTHTSRSKLTGASSGNIYTFWLNYHITVNPDGTVTSYHDGWTVECQ
jgi:hypothetical protein